LSKRQLAGVALIALAVVTWMRVVLVDHLPDQGYFSKYLEFAQSLPHDRLGEVSPAYLWLMVLLRGLNVHAIRTLQIIAVSIAALFAAIAAHRLAGPVAAIAAAIFILANRAALVCATDFEPETLIVLLDAVAIAALAYKRWFGAGVFLGFSTASRPVALAVAVVIGVWIVRREWRAAARFAVGVALPVLLAIAINFVRSGEVLLMDPGSAFYEGMNASSTGYAGVQPRIVKDIEAAAHQPDFLHVAYRIVAARAFGRPVTHRESNAWWTAKGTAFVKLYPVHAARLTLTKLLLSIHGYDAWDLVTMVRKARALEALPIWIPFSAMIALALLALFRRRSDAAIPLLFAAASAIPLIVFYVSARQREALLPALAVASGIAVAEIVAMWREHQREAIGSVIVIAVVTLLLDINGPRQSEDAYGWGSIGTDEQRAFDQALMLEERGDWASADSILGELQNLGYQPLRESRAVSSVAYYRARAALRMHRDARPQLAIATREAPGDLHVLATNAILGDPTALPRMRALHDPFSIELALAVAWSDAGDPAKARMLAEDVSRRIPEWVRPRAFAAH